MGRRQVKKGAGKAVQYQIDIEVAPIIYTRHHFEGLKRTIDTFASALINKNKLGGVDVDRTHVIVLWILNVQKAYPVGDPKREELLDQVDSPVFHEFWATRALAPTHQDKSRVFQKAQGGPSREDKKKHPGLIVMKNDALQLLVPQIKLLSFEQITFMDMVRWVLEANLGKTILRSDMVDLWDAIVHDIYSFQCSCSQAKKASESEEANSFTLEEYGQLVEEIEEATTLREILTRGVKHTSPAPHDTENEDGTEPEEGLTPAKRPRKRSRSRSAPSEDYVIPSIEFPPSAPAAAHLPQNTTHNAAPPTKKSWAKSQPTLEPKQSSSRYELMSQQDRGQTGQQGTRTPGNNPSGNSKEAANVAQGARMMQTERGTSAGRMRRGTYVYEKPEL